jgi:hypothetical protein
MSRERNQLAKGVVGSVSRPEGDARIGIGQTPPQSERPPADPTPGSWDGNDTSSLTHPSYQELT